MFRPTTLRASARPIGSSGSRARRGAASTGFTAVIRRDPRGPAGRVGRGPGAALAATVGGTAPPTRRGTTSRPSARRGVRSARGLHAHGLGGVHGWWAQPSRTAWTFFAARRPRLRSGPRGSGERTGQLQERLDVVGRPQAAVHHRRAHNGAEGDEGADEREEADSEDRLLDSRLGPERHLRLVDGHAGAGSRPGPTARWRGALRRSSAGRSRRSPAPAARPTSGQFLDLHLFVERAGGGPGGPPGCVTAAYCSAVWACSSWPW